MKYLKYLRYLIKHKWYVMIECFKVGLIWRGLMHDMSKFYPDEFFPYANYFYGKGEDIHKGRDATGYYKPTDTGDPAFDFAWLLHQKRNRHHWQWWILPEDEGGIKLIEIQHPYNLEMICDWVGAGKAQGRVSPKNNPYLNARLWYKTNSNKLQLHPNSKLWIEEKLDIKDD